LPTILGQPVESVAVQVSTDDRVSKNLPDVDPKSEWSALVGNPDRDNVLRFDAEFIQGAADHFLSPQPDFDCHARPARLRVDLAVFFLVNGDNFYVYVKNHEAGAGRTLVDCRSIPGHREPPGSESEGDTDNIPAQVSMLH
jgi:hypothetical protein